MSKKEIVFQCNRCLKRAGNKCSVFSDPAYQWRDGRQCFGYVDKPEDMIKMYEEIQKYIMNKNGYDVGYTPTAIKKKIEKYRQGLLKGVDAVGC